MLAVRHAAAIASLGDEAASLFRACWAETESVGPPPRYARSVVPVPYDEFAARILAADAQAIRRFVTSLYAGDVYVLKGAFSLAECRGMVERVYEFGRSRPPSFHKMLDGCPDFHRIIDSQVTNAYSVTSVRHGYYFFRWNGDHLKLFAQVTERWRIFKICCGLDPTQYETNLPSDGVIERLMLYSYPKGGGRLKTHVDPINNQKIVMGGMFSTRGVDFRTGGIYCLAGDSRTIDLESSMEAGDFMLTYPTVLHGVDPIDQGQEINWDTIDARWFLGLSIVDSDHVQERVTAQRVDDDGRAEV